MARTIAVVIPAKSVKVHLEAKLVSRGTRDETWVFSFSIDGNNQSWPGLIVPMNVREVERPDSCSWVDFGVNLNEYRRSHLGASPLVGFVSATNNEDSPVPLVQFELAIGLAISAFGLPWSPHVENEPAMPSLSLVV